MSYFSTWDYVLIGTVLLAMLFVGLLYESEGISFWAMMALELIGLVFFTLKLFFPYFYVGKFDDKKEINVAMGWKDCRKKMREAGESVLAPAEYIPKDKMTYTGTSFMLFAYNPLEILIDYPYFSQRVRSKDSVVYLYDYITKSYLGSFKSFTHAIEAIELISEKTDIYTSRPKKSIAIPIKTTSVEVGRF